MFVEQMLPRARERLVAIDGAAPVKDAAELMSKPHIDLLVVCGPDGGMVGVLTKADIVGQIRQCIGSGCIARVDTIMTREVVSCRAGESLQDIWSIIKSRGLQGIPVLDEARRPTGVIYARDAFNAC